MAIGTGTSLSSLERTWMQTHVTGSTPTMSLNDLKRQYFLSQINKTGVDINSLPALEDEWLRLQITTNGGTPAGRHTSDLWTQLVAILGLRVSKYLDENKQTYYRNVA